MSSQTSARIEVHFEAHGVSDVGRGRQNNEDALAVLPEKGLFIVADGIGGASSGEVASEAAVTVVPLKLDNRLRKLRKNAAKAKVETVIREVLQEINDALVRQAAERLGSEGTGTTIVLALLWKGLVLVAHLGDSRAYRWRKGELTQLTKDHSLAAQLVRWGKITETQAEDNPGRSTLLRYLGADEELDPDFFWLKPEPGTQLLLCTDGLTNMMADEDIAQILASSNTVDEHCQRLVDGANQAGGKDNITTVIVRFLECADTPTRAANSREMSS